MRGRLVLSLGNNQQGVKLLQPCLVEMLSSHREVLEETYGPSLRLLRARFGPPTIAYRPPRALPGRAEGRA